MVHFCVSKTKILWFFKAYGLQTKPIFIWMGTLASWECMSGPPKTHIKWWRNCQTLKNAQCGALFSSWCTSYSLSDCEFWTLSPCPSRKISVVSLRYSGQFGGSLFFLMVKPYCIHQLNEHWTISWPKSLINFLHILCITDPDMKDLWFFKDALYTNNPYTIQDVKQDISAAVNCISEHTLAGGM